MAVDRKQMKRRHGWGILGTGKVARIIAGALRASADGNLAAIASRSAERAAQFASGFGPARHYLGYAPLLADPDVEIVYVATHHPAHRDWAVAAAEAGKHVLCEKPLAVTAEGAAQIIGAARRNGVFLMEAFAYRCHPQTSRLAGLLRDGDIGEVRVIDAAFGYDAGPEPGNYLMVRSLGGGSILDVGCYTTSMAHLIAGAVPGASPQESLDVAGVAHIGQATGVDHYAAAGLTFPGGMMARVASAIQVNLDSTLRIYGSTGTITVPSPWLPGRDGAPSSIVVERSGSAPQEIRIDPGADLYVLEVDAVSRLVAEGRRSHPLMGWDESLANMRTLDGWRHSAGLDHEITEHGLRPSGAAAERANVPPSPRAAAPAEGQ
jgi:predicted dehydrogenase